ncbi:MAG: YidC/Oxa1 family membrane protein insertase [Lachnospiraceae bacterium]|jgi:YidC/Oxa1 family membrane protein insertase|nr:YidC/Oxa1 family membrane protein insertase [Lachnospiraceae bacterium]
MAILASAANWPIVGQIAWLLGKVMNFIYTMLEKILPSEHGLVGWSIIIFTILVYMLMLPLTIRQQKTSRLTSVMNPEIQAIRKKYGGKRDQASMLKMQEETQKVYDKYGTSMAGGCLPLLIQMPFLFGLYPVIYNITGYVPAIENAGPDVNRFFTIPDLTISPSVMMKNSGTYGIAPWLIIATAILLPVLSGLTQFLSIKLSQSISKQPAGESGQMEGTMKAMNYTMPLLSIFMVYTLASGLGLYWIISAVVRSAQQFIINKKLAKVDVAELIEKNKEKAAKKAKKRGERAEKVQSMAQISARSMGDKARLADPDSRSANQTASQRTSGAKNSLKDRAKIDKTNKTEKADKTIDEVKAIDENQDKIVLNGEEINASGEIKKKTNKKIQGSLRDKANLAKRFNENS